MTEENAFRADLFEGARAVIPLLPGAAAIGLVTGVAATTVGLSPVQAVAMAVVVFSPIVMLTAFHLLDVGAPMPIVVVASLVVGVRFAMLSLSLAPYFERLSTRWKWLLAYLLVTPTYVLSIERYEADPETNRQGYYLGASIPGWVTVQLALVLGLWFGTSVPSGWHLGFVITLAFIALLVRFLSDRVGRITALVSGVLAVIAVGLPFETGLIVAVVGGVASGVLLRRFEVV